MGTYGKDTNLYIYLFLLLRETVVSRTYGPRKNLYIYLFLLSIFGPVYYGPP